MTTDAKIRATRAPVSVTAVLQWLINPVRVLIFWKAFFVFAAGCSVYATLFLDIPCRLSDRYRRRHHHSGWNALIRLWGHTVFRLAKRILGLSLEVEGRIPEGRCIIVANHQSTIDIVLLMEALRAKNLKFVVKKELTRFMPNVSRALRAGGFGIVDFSSRARTLEGLRRYMEGLAEWDGSPVIYPEGQRTVDGSIASFRRTGIRMLVEATRLPVVPVVVDGVWRARSLGRFFVHLPGTRARMQVLTPVEPSRAMADAGALAARLELRMKEALGRMRERPETGAPG